MNGKLIMGIVMLAIIAGTLSAAFDLQEVKAQESSIEVWSDYTLDRDITFAGDGFIIKADGLTLDLNGHTITCSGAGVGVNLTYAKGTTVKNGEIVDFSCGIFVGSSQDNTITGNTVTNKGYGIHLEDSRNNTMTGNTFTYNWDHGIYLNRSDNNTMTGNTLTRNLYAIYLQDSGNNTVTGNTVTNNRGHGIYLYFSGNSTITANTVTNHEEGYGISLLYSGNNLLRENNMADNSVNFAVSGEDLSDYMNDIDTSNTVNGSPVYYWVNEHDRQVPSEAGYVGIVNSTRITVRDLTLTGNLQGVLLAYTENSVIENVDASNNKYGGIYLHGSENNTMTENTLTDNDDGILLRFGCNNNTLTGNTMTNNGFGIHLEDSDSNTLTGNIMTNNKGTAIHLWNSDGNTITGNTLIGNREGFWLGGYSSDNIILENNVTNNDFGVSLSGSTNNRIYHNNFDNNAQQISDYSWDYPGPQSVNIWDDGQIRPFFKEGNYWSDYSGEDEYHGIYQDETGGDWKGDTPYIVDENNQDNYPLMDKWWLGRAVDTNHDGAVNILDISLAAVAFGSDFPDHPRWDYKADVTIDHIVNIIDIAAIAKYYTMTDC